MVLLPFFCLLCATPCGAFAGGDGDKNERWDAYDGNLFEEIVRPEAEAWREVAKVICPNVCDDDYTQWAGHVADSLCADLISRPQLSYGEQLFRLYEIQTYLISGMSYLSALLSIYPGTEYYSPAGGTLLDCTALFHEYSDTLKISGYDSPEGLMDLHYKLVYWFLNCFVSVLGDQNFASERWRMRYWGPSVILFSDLDEIQAYRWSERLNNSDFYCSYLDIMRSFIYDENLRSELSEKFSGGEDLYIAHWLDEQSIPAIVCCDKLYHGDRNDGKMEISLEDHTAYMKQAAEYRVHMIKVFAEAIVTLSPCGKSLPSIRMFLNVEKAQ